MAGFEAAAGTLGVLDDPVNHGRLGRRDSEVARPDSEPAVHGPLRIVGTGEFTYAPFRLAERLRWGLADEQPCKSAGAANRTTHNRR